MRDPCPYCKLPGVTLARVDLVTQELVRDIRDHPCPAFEMSPRLTATRTDMAFIRDARNSSEGLEAWRKSLR